MVININNAPKGWETDPRYVYIGRPGHSLDGKWGNPFKMESEENRAEVLIKYTNWLVNEIKENYKFTWKIAKLADKTLVCFCAPKPCHGDILSAFAKTLDLYVGNTPNL